MVCFCWKRLLSFQSSTLQIGMASSEPWAQLVCCTDIEAEPIAISKNKFVIGRAKESDLSLAGNKLVSGRHCFIERQPDGTVKLQDTSTNGTLVNMTTKLSNGMTAVLSHGDEFHVVFKKGSEALRLGYLYQDLSELQAEDSSFERTQSYTDNEFTQQDSPTACEPLPMKSDVPAKKRKLETHTSQVATTSKMALELTTSECSSGTTNVPSEECNDKLSVETVHKEQDVQLNESRKKQMETKDDFEETLRCMICQDLLHDCISLQPCMHSFCSGCYSGWMTRSSECPTCRLRVERINKNHIVNNLVDAYLKTHPDKMRSEEDLKELDDKNTITRDMLYPKRRRHTYDGSDEEDSYSDSESGDVVEISLNNVATSGVFRFTPSLVSATPIDRLLLGPPRTICRQCPDYNSQVASTAQPALTGQSNLPPGTISPLTTSGQSSTSLPTTTSSSISTAAAGSHLLSSNLSPVITVSNAGAATPTSSTSSVSVAAPPSSSQPVPGETVTSTNPAQRTPPVFVCAPRQNHVSCQCCYQPMPDRRHERVTDASIPQTSCCVCWRNFCHLYWGCRRLGCHGCISQFKDVNFTDRDLSRVLIENEFETTVLKDYLQSVSKTFNDVLVECCSKLDSNQFSCPDQTRGLHGSTTVICYACALRNFKELVYQYRKSIPNSHLPESAKSRPDCYWGKNCRTAKNKPHHAKNFNHICEQTRFT